MIMSIDDLNAEINQHFPSNNGVHRCYEIHGKFVYMMRDGYSKILSSIVARFIFRSHPQFEYVNYPGFVFTKRTLDCINLRRREDE